MKRTNTILSILKIIILIVVIAIIVGVIINLFPIIMRINTKEGQIELKEVIDKTGIYGLVILFFLQFAQIFLVILPGEPIEVLAGMCYGAVGGTIFILVSVAIITSFIYFLVKKYGKKLIYQIWDKEKVDKLEQSKWFQNQKNIEKIFLILFLLVGTPKDLLVYLGALFPIKSYRFIAISTFGRIPSVISSTIAGAYISYGKWKISIVVYLVTIIATILGFILAKMINKKEEKINEEK